MQSVFAYTGSLQSYVVPPGVQSVTVALWGAGGGGMGVNSAFKMDVAYFAGGSGGFTSCDLSVSSGQQLDVVVGGGGQAAGCWGCAISGSYGGGGVGYAANYAVAAAGGGGRSSIQLTAGVDAVTAGGGGGGGGYPFDRYTGSNGGGCGGGLSGCDTGGTGSVGIGGGGGSQTSGGVGVSNFTGDVRYFGAGSPGAQYIGGDGMAVQGSGGGGGYYGGAGGGSFDWLVGSGGGGSGYVGSCSNPAEATTQPGSSSADSTAVLPAGSTLHGYVSGVGVGSAGSTTLALPVNGGDGLVVITVSGCSTGYTLSAGQCVASIVPSAVPSSHPTSLLDPVPTAGISGKQ